MGHTVAVVESPSLGVAAAPLRRVVVVDVPCGVGEGQPPVRSEEQQVDVQQDEHGGELGGKLNRIVNHLKLNRVTHLDGYILPLIQLHHLALAVGQLVATVAAHQLPEFPKSKLT